MVELPEPNTFGDYVFPDGAEILRPLNRPKDDRDAKWLAGATGMVGVTNDDKKRFHDTPEGAAAWLASHGYGPRGTRNENGEAGAETDGLE